MPSDGLPQYPAPIALLALPRRVNAERCLLDSAAHLGDSAIVRLTTEIVEPHRRFDFWVGAISKVMFAITSSTPDRARFGSEMTVARLDEMVLLRIEGSARHSVRSQQAISRSSDRSFHLVGDFDQPSVVEYRGSMLSLAPGDLVMVDSQELHSVRYAERMRGVNLKVPPAWARSWLRDPERMTGKRIEGSGGWGAALSNFLAELSPRVIDRAPLSRKVMADNIGALLALVEGEVLGASPTNQAWDRQLFERIGDLVRQRAPEHGLSAIDIASALGISERTLHRALTAAGLTFSQLLTQNRVELARRMLESGNLRRLSTGEIGSRAGFSDPSHFVRVATRHLGLTPAKYRSALTNGASVA